MKAARKAFESWRLVPAPKRGEIIFKAGRILKERKEKIAKLMTREMGKVLKETRGDIQEGIDTAESAGYEGRRLAGESVPSELKNKFCISMRMPIGVCAMITPWNFPIAPFPLGRSSRRWCAETRWSSSPPPILPLPRWNS